MSGKDAGRIVVAIGGNPNSGKTSLFNALTGARQKVGNWSGVTVEKKEGRVRYGGYEIVFVDLPGTYSLTAYSVEEIIARNFIVHEKPDVVLDVIDAGNLERNLYLAVQLIEMGGKFVFALNMADIAEKQGLRIDSDRLATLLGGPVVFTVGSRGTGVDAILDRVVRVHEGMAKKSRHIHVYYGAEIAEEIKKIQGRIRVDRGFSSAYSTRWLSIKLLENDADARKKVARECASSTAVLEQVTRSRGHLHTVFGDDPETFITDQRYGFISGLLRECVALGERRSEDLSARIDRVFTHRLLGIPLLVFFIWLMFQVSFRVGRVPMGWIDAAFALAGRGVGYLLPDGVMRSLVVDGILNGVGSVAVFLPNILLLFLMISFFEDTGYMARAAFVMDRVMHLMGLHGKSFISMIMGFGCNAPAIMAARTLESEKDRILTILVNPLMSCSARLPVYVLVAGAFFDRRAPTAVFSLYLLGAVLAVLVGRLFRRVFFRGVSEPFVMELPPYRLPTLRSLSIHMWERTTVFVRKMGTVILAGSIAIWFLGTVPEKGERSYIGTIGRAVAPFFHPLGFGWKEGVSLLTGFVAKEIIVSTLGVLYGGNAGGEETGGRGETGSFIRERSGLTPVTAYAFLVFVLVYTPCLATVGMIRQETGSWRWALFSVFYELTLAWILAFLVVRVGGLLALVRGH
jgi:ferrous iron transport protein B